MPQTPEERKERLKRRSELLPEYGDGEGIPDGTVARWYKVFDITEGGQPKAIYTYVAIAFNDRWSVCGQQVKVDWLDLLIQVERDNLIDDPIEQIEFDDSWYLAFQPEDDNG